MHVLLVVWLLRLLQIELPFHAQMCDPHHFATVKAQILAQTRILLDAPSLQASDERLGISMYDIVPDDLDLFDDRMAHLTGERVQNGLYLW